METVPEMVSAELPQDGGAAPDLTILL